MLKGMTAQYLLRRTYRVKRGDVVLAHAAAGGVGLHPRASGRKSLGATVIGVVGSEAKAELARKHGCKHVLISGAGRDRAKREEADEGCRRRRGVRRGGQGHVHRVARFAFGRSGMMVSFGNASGPPPSLNPLELSQARLAVSHAAHVVPLHREARGSAWRRRRSCSLL